MVFKYFSKKKMTVYLLLMVVAGSTNNIDAVMMKNFTQAALSKDMYLFFITGFFTIIAVLLFMVVNILIQIIRNAIVEQVNVSIKSIVIRYLLYIGVRNNDTSAQLSTLNNDLKMLENNDIKSELNIIDYAFVFVSSFALACYYDWVTACTIFVCGFLPATITKIVGKSLSKLGKEWSTANASFVQTSSDIIDAVPTVRLYAVSKIIVNRFMNSTLLLEKSNRMVNTKADVTKELVTSISTITSTVIPFGVGIYRTIIGALSLPNFVALTQIALAVSIPVVNILSLKNRIDTTESIRQKLRTYETALINKKQISPVTDKFKSLSLNNVSLNFGKKNILNDFSININKGQKILITAPSGTGKTTLLLALIDQLNFDRGKYAINNKELTSDSEFKASAIQSYFSMIRQKPIIFDDTILFNITLRTEYTTDEIMRASKLACLTQLIKERGLDYNVGNQGCNLSGGQLQRIEIARALIRHRPILLADEITAALDNTTANKIRENIFGIKDLTLIEVAHHINQNYSTKYTTLVNL